MQVGDCSHFCDSGVFGSGHPLLQQSDANFVHQDSIHELAEGARECAKSEDRVDARVVLSGAMSSGLRV